MGSHVDHLKTHEVEVQGLRISQRVTIPFSEIQIKSICSGGPGGQHVNKSATAIHLSFDIGASSLPDFYKERLKERVDHRITSAGLIVIKAQEFRSQDKNRQSAFERLKMILVESGKTQKKRVSTKPSKASKVKRLNSKTKRSQVKAMRRKVDDG